MPSTPSSSPESSTRSWKPNHDGVYRRKTSRCGLRRSDCRLGFVSRYRGFDRNERAIIILRLIARDGLRCGICDGILDQLIATANHPAATTIDHIVALRDGGEVGGIDQLENLRLAHSLCNGRRVRNERRRPTWFAAELSRALSCREDRLAISNEGCHAHRIEPLSPSRLMSHKAALGSPTQNRVEISNQR
jgi:5-methylcytosine-specific restriction endonuclease McrA